MTSRTASTLFIHTSPFSPSEVSRSWPQQYENSAEDKGSLHVFGLMAPDVKVMDHIHVMPGRIVTEVRIL